MRVAVVALLVLASTFASAGAADARYVSGLRGIVMQGPTAPVCREGDACEEPAAGVILQFRRAGKLVVQVKTTQLGRYSVRLAAGSYAVTSPRRRIGSGLTPRVVRVPRGRIGRVDFHLDTGIQ